MMESFRVAAMSSSDMTRALEVFKNGGFVIVTDDEKREILKKTIYRSNVRGESPPGNYLR